MGGKPRESQNKTPDHYRTNVIYIEGQALLHLQIDIYLYGGENNTIINNITGRIMRVTDIMDKKKKNFPFNFCPFLEYFEDIYNKRIAQIMSIKEYVGPLSK